MDGCISKLTKLMKLFAKSFQLFLAYTSFLKITLMMEAIVLLDHFREGSKLCRFIAWPVAFNDNLQSVYSTKVE